MARLVKTLTPYLGALGLGFLVAGVLLLAMQRQNETYWTSFLIAGLVCSAFYTAGRFSELAGLFSRRSAKRGANAALLIVIVAGIVVLVNIIADQQATQWDFTAARQYSLSEQTAKILGELATNNDTEVEIVLLDRRGTEQQLRASDLLQLYDDASSRVRVHVIDPEAEPERALAYTNPTEPGVALGTIIVGAPHSRGRPGRTQRATAATEPEVTNAIIRVLKTETKKIYFTSGHQEKDPLATDANGISGIASKLEDSAYVIETLVIARSQSEDALRIPEDAAAIVVAGPQTDFLQAELDALQAYLDGGGSAIFLLDPVTQGLTPELDAFLVEQGIVVGNDVVVDALAQPPVYPVVQSYGLHPIVESFGNVMSIFPFARSVTTASERPEGSEIRELFTTADENSWAETRLEELAELRGPTPEQTLGPIGLAVAATIPRGPREEAVSRLVVVGDSDFIVNELTSAPLLNADLFLNMTNWVVQDEDLISIRPRKPEDRRIALSARERTNVFFLSLFIIPGVVAVTGVSAWWGRRAK